MLKGVIDLARPMLLALEPERAHELTLKTLESGIYPAAEDPDPAILRQTVWGLDFPNPLGIAAGFDKNARVPDQILAMGFGFAEVGTVTPEPQLGNPRPRVFRLIEDRAIINRLGFNNAGHAAMLTRLKRRRPAGGVVGVNVGANKDSDDRAGDYVSGLAAFIDVASFFTINVSSPNTPGLRDLQAPAALDELLGRVLDKRRKLVEDGHPWRPVIVKLAPDIAEDDLPAITAKLVERGADGICVGNTTLSRAGLTSLSRAGREGGLSGRPLFRRATRMLARVYELTGGEIPLIGVGGVDSGETALAKIEAGASLIQLYTGLVYEGPGLVRRIKTTLARQLETEGLAGIASLTGRRSADWTRADVSEAP